MTAKRAWKKVTFTSWKPTEVGEVIQGTFLGIRDMDTPYGMHPAAIIRRELGETLCCYAKHLLALLGNSVTPGAEVRITYLGMVEMGETEEGETRTGRSFDVEVAV